jgi:hypothetical protein
MSALNWGELVADSGDSSNKFEILPDGDYDAKVVEASHTLTAKGKTMFKVKLQVLQGPYANRFLWDNLVISPESPQALGIFFRQMKGLGLDQEYFKKNPSNDQVAGSINGATVRVKVGNRPYLGEPRNEIKAYNAVSAGGQGGGFPGQPQPPAPQGQAYPPRPQDAPQPPRPQDASQQQYSQQGPPQPPQQQYAQQPAVENPWTTPQGSGYPAPPETPF